VVRYVVLSLWMLVRSSDLLDGLDLVQAGHSVVCLAAGLFPGPANAFQLSHVWFGAEEYTTTNIPYRHKSR